jgi:hypothetical protein
MFSNGLLGTTLGDPISPRSPESSNHVESNLILEAFHLAFPKVKLVGGTPTPLKNISQSGLLFPIYGKNKSHVPNHQPVNILKPVGTEHL